MDNMSGALIAAFAAIAVAIVSGAVSFAASRRSSGDSLQLGIINAGQASLKDALAQANQDLTAARVELEKLRQEMVVMRKQVNDLWENNRECEEQRALLMVEVATLRSRVVGDGG